MAEATGIQWTNRTWNPWRGCKMISPGCANCYMFTEQRRYGSDPSLVQRTKTWDAPARWHKRIVADAEKECREAGGVGSPFPGDEWRLFARREMVFTCSWSDWFIENADPWRDEAWAVVKACPFLTFQILTKRPERIRDHLPADWGEGYPNVWLGVSVEDQPNADCRIPELLRVPARVRFLSCEPLLGPVDLRRVQYENTVEIDALTGDHGVIRPLRGRSHDRISWVICGGESGPRARPCPVEWIRDLVRQCREAGVACFVKQLGSAPESVAGKGVNLLCLRDRKGGDMSEWPEDLRVREWPA